MPSPFERRQAPLTVRSARPNRSSCSQGKGVKGELPAGCQLFGVPPRRPLLRTFFDRTNSVSTAVLFWTARRWGEWPAKLLFSSHSCGGGHSPHLASQLSSFPLVACP